METASPQSYSMEPLGLASSLPQTLGALEAIVSNASPVHALTSEDSVVVVQALLDKLVLLELVTRDGDVDDGNGELQIKLWMILPEILVLVNQQTAVQIADQSTLLDTVLQSLNPQSVGRERHHACFYWALKCVTVLKQQHGIMVYPLFQGQLVHAVVNFIHNGLDIDCAQLLVRALKAFSTESVTCEMEIERLAAVRLASIRSELKLAMLQYVVTLRDLSYRAYNAQWDALDHIEWVSTILKGGTQFEKLVALEALLPDLSTGAGARRFLWDGGVNALLVLTRRPSTPVRERAQALLSAIAATDENYIGELIASQLRHPEVDILAPSFCKTGEFACFYQFSVPECMYHLTSHQEGEAQYALKKLLPRDKHILAALCLDHELVPVLLTFVTESALVDDAVKDMAWTLVVEMSFELPTVGVIAWTGSDQQQLIATALQMLRAKDEYSLVRRQQAVQMLTAPLNKTEAARNVLVFEQGGIPELVNCLAHEDDGVLSDALCDLVRDLEAESPDYSSEIDLVVRSLLDTSNSVDFAHFASLRYQNVLSVYRKPRNVVLGLAGEDALSNLKRNIEILTSGNKVEKRIVLQQLRIRAVSWSQSHWDVLAQRMLEIVGIVLCETQELKQLAIEIFRILAAVDDGCREKVLSAQRAYRTSDPAFFAEFMVSDETGVGPCKGDGDDEMQSDEEKGWVAIDYPCE